MEIRQKALLEMFMNNLIIIIWEINERKIFIVSSEEKNKFP